MFDLSSKTLLSYYAVLGEPGWKEKVTFKCIFQSCRSAFKRKEGRNVVTWNRGRGQRDQRTTGTGQFFTVLGEQQKSFKSMESPESLEISSKEKKK